MMLRAFSFAHAQANTLCVCAMVCAPWRPRGPSVFRGVAQGAQSDMRVAVARGSGACAFFILCGLAKGLLFLWVPGRLY